MDESTNISSRAQFISFVRYDTKYDIAEDILFWHFYAACTIQNSSSVTIFPKKLKTVMIIVTDGYRLLNQFLRQFFSTCWDFNKHKRNTYWNIKWWNVEARFFYSESKSILNRKILITSGGLTDILVHPRNWIPKHKSINK